MNATDVTELKGRVRERDGHRCTECGVTDAEHRRATGRKLDVHRLKPGSPYTVDGCVTLCRKCHIPKPKSPRGTRPRRTRGGMEIRMVSLPASLFDAMEQLAKDHCTCLNCEISMACIAYLERHGFWPPPADKGKGRG